MGWGVLGVKRGLGSEAGARLDQARGLMGEKKPPAVWYWARVLAGLVSGREREMLTIAEEGVQAYPRSAALRNNLGVLQERANRSETAEQTLAAALEEDPTLPQLSKNIGDLHYRAGRADEAQQAYLRAVKLAPRLGEDVYFKLGNIAFKQLRRAEAEGYWREVLAVNPAHEMARRNLETLEKMA